MWFDLSAAHVQFFTDSASSVVMATTSSLHAVEFTEPSTSAALQAAPCALCYDFPAVTFIMMRVGRPREIPLHGQVILYVLQTTSFSGINLSLSSKKTEIAFEDLLTFALKEAPPTSTSIIYLWKIQFKDGYNRK